MTGKTHLVMGEAAALAVMQPVGWQDVAWCLGAAAIGAVICDIDIDSSNAHKKVEAAVIICTVAVILLGLAEWKFQLGITQEMIQRRDIWPKIAGGAGLFILCIFGKEQPHRSFMHSLLAVCLFSGLVYLILPEAAGYFAVAMSSHLVLDIFNKKDIRLWYPFSGGVSLKLCRADGAVNQILFYVGCAAAGILTVIGLMR